MLDHAMYDVGIDPGARSLGCIAIRVDETGAPLELLSSAVYIHDGGVDPDHAKAAATRVASAGAARRMRRLIRQRRKRLDDLDAFLAERGYPLDEPGDRTYGAWLARAQLASAKIGDPQQLQHLLSVAVRHIARHRGWRNPWSQVESLLEVSEDSEELAGLKQRLAQSLGPAHIDAATAGQVVSYNALSPRVKLRGGPDALLSKLMQSDNANEIHRYAAVQGLDPELVDELIRKVFAAKSPRGSAAARAGRDPLPGQEDKPRATKASLAFQHYRVRSIVANLRISESGHRRALTTAERCRVSQFLLHHTDEDDPTWAEVAEHLDVPRGALHGTAAVTADGERASAKPPVNVTDKLIRKSSIQALATWWKDATLEEQEALITLLTGDEDHSEHRPEAVAVQGFVAGLSDTDVARLFEVRLPAGRAAYSADSLNQLSAAMRVDEFDVHAARIAVFGIPQDWAAPADPIGAPTGNPAVDRALRHAAQWLTAVERRWGPPRRVTIEHVRDGLLSERKSREIDRDNNKRHLRNQELAAQIKKDNHLEGTVPRSGIIKQQILTRQGCICLYCGKSITYATAELDHIVARAGVGSTNHRGNLAAACRGCNDSKNATTFRTWADSGKRPQVSVDAAIERVRSWTNEPGRTAKEHKQFLKSVTDRLTRTDDDPDIDGRSMESTAWMANELAARIRHHFKASAGADVDVSVYRGGLTADARRASGIEKRIEFIGGEGKTRLDRRHHVVDAAVVALMTPSAARTLAERGSMRDAQRLSERAQTWKTHHGSTPGAVASWQVWCTWMEMLADLLNPALTQDQIPVMRSKRLKLAAGRVHEDRIYPLARRTVGDALSANEIDRAATPALWTALTRHPDYHRRNGLPASTTRSIRVRGQHMSSDDSIEMFQTPSAAVAVRGGYAELGTTIHHSRIYRIHGGRKNTYAMLRVFSVDLHRHRNSDLFAAPIPAQTISMRTAVAPLRAAIAEDRAEYLGWMVLGEELLLDTSTLATRTDRIGKFLTHYPDTARWRLDGFYGPNTLRLRPLLLAAEGLPDDAPDDARKILDRPGWTASVNALFTGAAPVIIRRDVLGRIRWKSEAHLPTAWTA